MVTGVIEPRIYVFYELFNFMYTIVFWCLEGGKTQALSLLYMITDTAARLNAIDFFRIIFSTQVGHSVFKSCKEAQTPLEEIARGNGHVELAYLLEQKHLMYVSKYIDYCNCST